MQKKKIINSFFRINFLTKLKNYKIFYRSELKKIWNKFRLFCLDRAMVMVMVRVEVWNVVRVRFRFGVVKLIFKNHHLP